MEKFYNTLKAKHDRWHCGDLSGGKYFAFVLNAVPATDAALAEIDK